MSLNAATYGNAENMVVNATFAGLVSSIMPTDVGLNAHDVFPALPFVSNGNGVGFFVRYNMADNLTAPSEEDLVRRVGAGAKKVNKGLRVESFQVGSRHLDAIVYDKEATIIRSMTNGMDDPHSSRVAWVRQLMLQAKENRAAAFAANTNNVGSNITPSNPWSDYNNSDPVMDLINAMISFKYQSGLEANTMRIPWDVAMKLAYHPKIKYLRGNTERTGLTFDALAELLRSATGINDIKVLKNVSQNSKNRKRTPTTNLRSTWGKNVYLYYTPPQVAWNMPMWAVDALDTVDYGGLGEDGTGDTAGVFTWYENDIEATIHRIREDSDLTLLNKELALAFRGVIA